MILARSNMSISPTLQGGARTRPVRRIISLRRTWEALVPKSSCGIVPECSGVSKVGSKSRLKVSSRGSYRHSDITPSPFVSLLGEELKGSHHHSNELTVSSTRMDHLHRQRSNDGILTSNICPGKTGRGIEILSLAAK